MNDQNFPTLQQLRADLDWTVASMPLLSALSAGDDEPRVQWLTTELCRRWWRDYSAPSLYDSDLDQLGTMRLGNYCEKLWRLWLREHSHWQLLAHNMPVRDNLRTLGEFDLVLRERRTLALEHWELAVKFYLGYGDLDNPACWHGPQFRDRLDRKLAHLLQDQSQLAFTSAGAQTLAALGKVQTVRVIVKGRLFYPLADFLQQHHAAFAGEAHERAFWCMPEELNDAIGDGELQLLAREQMLAPVCRHQTVSPHDLLRQWTGERPVLFAVFRQGDEAEYSRGMLVPAQWPAQARVHALAV